MQIWMEHYFCCLSVRLGTIVVAALTMMQLLVPAVVFLSIGIKIFDPLIELFENDEQYNKIDVIKRIFIFMENDPTNFLLLLSLYLFLHAFVCILTIYAALKLLKWLLVPFIVLELIRVAYCLALHIVLMIVLKKIINLGFLIALTLIGGYVILFLSYNWATSVALFQIFTLIRTTRYRALYGEDPFVPPPSQELNQGSSYDGHRNDENIENVRVLVTPNPDEIIKQKRLNAQSNWRKKSPVSQVIPVIPVKEYRAQRRKLSIVGSLSNNNRKMWRGFAQQPQQHRPQHNSNDIYYDSDLAKNYENWQRMELVAPSERYQRTSNITQNWRW